MDNLTIGEIGKAIALITPIVGIFFFLFKIYNKIDSNDKLTRVSLKATKVMLDHFIEDKIGNGEFRQARKEIDDALIK